MAVGVEADGGVIEEHRDKSGDDDGRAVHRQEDAEGKELAERTEHEAESDGVLRAEAVSGGAVNRRYRAGQPAAGNTMEGFGQLGNEGAYPQLQDGEVNGEFHRRQQDVGEEWCTFLVVKDEAGGKQSQILFLLHVFGEILGAVLQHELLTEGGKDDAKEEGHEDGGGDHVLVEDGEPARQLDVFQFLRFLSRLGFEEDFGEFAE